MRHLSNFGPNWYATVMGTGIVATALAGLPEHFAGQAGIALALWIIDVLLLISVTIATVLHWINHRDNAKKHLRNPAMGPFYGAPAMGFMTVGIGFLTCAPEALGGPVRFWCAVVLWGIGSVLGVWTATHIPWLLFRTKSQLHTDPFAGWFMPLVPPVVSATGGGLLAGHLSLLHTDTGYWNQLLVILGFLFLIGGLISSAVMMCIVIPTFFSQGPGPLARRPTWFIVLGPLGQSATAALTLAFASGPAPAQGFDAAAVVAVVAPAYAILALALGVVWFLISAVVLGRALATGLKFSMSWWSMAFPLGTCTTGFTALSKLGWAHWAATGATIFFACLALAWLACSISTARFLLTDKSRVFGTPSAVPIVAR